MEANESRKYPRLKTDFPVQLEVGGATFRERAFSLGGGGLFITTADQLPIQPGTEMAIRFRPAKHMPMIDTKARVSYLAPGRGAAIEFTEISAEDQRRLLGFIHSRSSAVRKHARAPLATQIEAEQARSLAFSQEISAGGMFIESSNPQPIGSRLTLRFNLGDSGEIIVLMAEVSYHAGNLGMGVRFVEASPEDLKRIQDYVASAESARVPRQDKGAKKQSRKSRVKDQR